MPIIGHVLNAPGIRVVWLIHVAHHSDFNMYNVQCIILGTCMLVVCNHVLIVFAFAVVVCPLL